MEKSSPRIHRDRRNYQPPPPPLLPSPSSSNSSSGSPSSGVPIARSEPAASPYPTTFVQADASTFKQVVQMLTGAPDSPAGPSPPVKSTIPPIKSIPKRSQQSSSGFKLYERRKNLKINPMNPFVGPGPGSGFSPRNPEILSPSILDFPALVLSPVTPLIPDPFGRSGSCYASPLAANHNHLRTGGSSPAGMTLLDDDDPEGKAIKEKGFYLHPSPSTTPREAEPPRLLPLFPLRSPRGSAANSS